MGRPSVSHESPNGLHGFVVLAMGHGFPLLVSTTRPWVHSGSAMGLPWVHHGSTMGLSLFSHGSPVTFVCVWVSVDVPWVYRGASMGQSLYSSGRRAEVPIKRPPKVACASSRNENTAMWHDRTGGVPRLLNVRRQPNYQVSKNTWSRPSQGASNKRGCSVGLQVDRYCCNGGELIKIVTTSVQDT